MSSSGYFRFSQIGACIELNDLVVRRLKEFPCVKRTVVDIVGVRTEREFAVVPIQVKATVYEVFVNLKTGSVYRRDGTCVGSDQLWLEQ